MGVSLNGQRGILLTRLVPVIYAGLAFALFHAAWADPTRRLVGGCCDSPAPLWFLQWVGYAILHGQDPLFTHFVGLPTGVNVMWQPPAMPIIGLAVTPVEFVFGPFVTYNLVATLALALSSWACYFALRRWVGGTGAPFLGGLLYGFSPFMAAQSLGHPALTVAFVAPLFLLVLTDILAYRRWPVWRSGVTLGALAAVQFLISQEGFAIMVIGAALVTGLLAVLRPRAAVARLRPTAIGMALGTAVCLVVLALPLLMEFLGKEQLHGLLRPQNTFVTDLANLVLPNPVVAQWSPFNGAYVLHWQWDVAEAGAFLGPFLIIVLATVVATRRRELRVQVAALAAAAMLVLSLGPSLHVAGRDLGVPLPWVLFERLPLLDNLLPVRMTGIFFVGVAVLVAEGVHAVQGWRSGWRRAAGTAGIIAALVPLVPVAAYQAWTPVVPSFFRSARASELPRDGVVFVVPFPRDQPDDVTPMLWQALTGLRFRMPGGYVFLPAPGGNGLGVTGGTPNALTARLDAIAGGSHVLGPTKAEAAVLRSILLHTYHPVAVVVGPMPHEGLAVRLMSQVLGKPPTWSGGVALWLGTAGGSPARR